MKCPLGRNLRGVNIAVFAGTQRTGLLLLLAPVTRRLHALENQIPVVSGLHSPDTVSAHAGTFPDPFGLAIQGLYGGSEYGVTDAVCQYSRQHEEPTEPAVVSIGSDLMTAY